MDNRKAEFIEMYKALCEEYGMHIGICSNESGSNVWQDVEEVLHVKELEGHFTEIESC